MKVRLKIMTKRNNGAVVSEYVELDRDSITVGAGDADLQLDGAEISQHHALMYQGLRGELRIMDLNSETGTHSDERRIADVELRPGSLVRLGDYAVVIEAFTPSWHTLLATLDVERLRNTEPKPDPSIRP